MMKKHLLALSAAAVLLAPQTVGAEGFALNEWSAEGMAMGGARMFAEEDAANMAYNPASMTKVTGEKFKVSATYLSPHGKYRANSEVTNVDNQEGDTCTKSGNESGHNRVHPGWVPGSYYVKQLNDTEWVGMGVFSRFGMVSQFERNSIPGSNSFSAKLNGLSMGVNYAKKIDKKWAASLGAEVNYVGLQVDKNLYSGGNMASPIHVEGESYALGWNAAANYEFDDKNEIGVVYRSKVKHSMEADYDVHGFSGAMASSCGGNTGDAYGVVTLPESWAIGYNHKFDDKTRVELNGTWTRWSRYDALNIAMGGGFGNFLLSQGKPAGSFADKNWEDGWRYAIGIEHKLSDKYSLLGGIAYDESSIPYDGADFMVPTGRRITYTIGTQYRDEKQTVALALGWMDVGDLDILGHPEHGDSFTHAEMYDSYTKMVSVSYQRNF